MREPISRYQCVFDAALEAIEVHAPAMEPDRRITFATSIALKAREAFNGKRSDDDATAP